MPIWCIWNAASAKKRLVAMASRSSKANPEWTGRRIDFPAFSEALAKRRAELGEPELPRNSGQNRTPSKRALLKAIEDLGGKW